MAALRRQPRSGVGSPQPRHRRADPAGPDADLAAERRAEAEQGAALSAQPDVLAVVSGLDPAGWRLVRFVLRAGMPTAGTAEIVHLAAPGIAVLRHVAVPA